MYQDAHNEKSGRHGIRMNRTAVLLIAIILLISTAVGSTAAFLITKTDPVENTFEYASVSCEVTKNPDTGYVQVKNTGTIEAYIRAVYVVNWLDSGNNIAASVPADYSYTVTENPSGKWIKGSDGFFYYPVPVAPGASTEGSLLTCTASYPAGPQYTLSAEVLADSIQSVPEKAVHQAWGVTISNGRLSVN